jgi:hypothetical protein
MTPERDPIDWDAAIATGFPCECGTPLAPGLHRTRGGPCLPEPPASIR